MSVIRLAIGVVACLVLYAGVHGVVAEPATVEPAQVTAQVFLDSRCDGFYVVGQDIPLVGVNVMVATATAITRDSGWAWVGPVDASLATMTAKVDLPATFAGFDVVPCYTDEIELVKDDFRGGAVKWLTLRFGATIKKP